MSEWEIPASAYQTKASAAAAAIRQAIYTGQLPPGSRLVLRKLQGELRLSITPIREALQVLQRQGLVVGEPHRGFHVAELKLANVEEVYWLRGMLEPVATGLAVANIDGMQLTRLHHLLDAMNAAISRNDLELLQESNREFHMKIYAEARRPVLFEHIALLWRNSPFGSLRLVPERPHQAFEEHTRVLEALEARDKEAAEREMAVHIQSARASVISFLRSAGHSPTLSAGPHDGPLVSDGAGTLSVAVPGADLSGHVSLPSSPAGSCCPWRCRPR